MRLGILMAALAAFSASAWACDAPVSVCPKAQAGAFALIQKGLPAAVYADAKADSAVQLVAKSFAQDLERVSGKRPSVIAALKGVKTPVVIIGVAGQSPVIDGLIRAGKISAADVKGWEAYRQIVVANPAPGIASALVIVGADRRGAVFGTYDISGKIGVSPAYWFADVPVKHQDDLFITAGSRFDQPKVRYRGFFINDEAPAFSSWTQEKFGGANHKAYAHIFEYLLRMKGNYLWPAMWAPRAFNADDPQNTVLADAMGVVMGTSHHEPMTRAQDEWHRNKDQGITGGKWDYTTNAENLRKFWRGGIERMMSKGDGKGYESLVTVGMRGDGDEPMAEGTATKLLETIVADQRKIIAGVTGKPADQTPQVWALYKEVQDYYDHGMNVPDDVILLFADDNWGQLRRLATRDQNRKGGFGIYYHFDYVGGPRNYKWINTNQIEKVWQQMDLAYRANARSLWVVNVGDIKPMEYPLQFFLDQAWDPEAMTPGAVKAYPAEFAKKTFGPEQADAIGGLLTRYSQYAARKKPELIDPSTFSLADFERFTSEWHALVGDMQAVKAKLPQEAQDAYFQLVEHPILALSNLYDLYYAVAVNRKLAAENNPLANLYADKAEAAFKRDQEISDAYHKIAGGKWNGMMLQTHIGYESWQEPRTNIMPPVKRVEGKGEGAALIVLPQPPFDGVSLEATDFTRANNGKGLTWTAIPHLGRTKGAVLALPQGAASTTLADNVSVEYDVTLPKSGDVTARLYFAPTIDTRASGGLKFAIVLDNGPAQTLTFDLIPTPGGASTPQQKAWVSAVSNNIHIVEAKFPAIAAGKHRVKIIRLDDNVVLEKLVLATGAIPESYLGP